MRYLVMFAIVGLVVCAVVYYPFDFYEPPYEWFGAVQFVVAVAGVLAATIGYEHYLKHFFPLQLTLGDNTLSFRLHKRVIDVEYGDIESILVEKYVSKWVEDYGNESPGNTKKVKSSHYEIIVRTKRGDFIFVHQPRGFRFDMGDVVTVLTKRVPGKITEKRLEGEGWDYRRIRSINVPGGVS